DALETRNVYDMRQRHYLLDRLENDSKERIDTSGFTVEHVMPQNEELCAEWQTMLGSDWKNVQEVWLHRLGNITLTGYNSTYSDLAFERKKTLVDKEGREVGFDFSPLRLNKFIREQPSWTATQMERRGKDLASRAVGIWPTLMVDMQAVKEVQLEERKAQATKYSLDELELDAESKCLFGLLRPQILALGDDVVELCGPSSMTYRVYDFFLEVIPRKKRLLLMLNLEYEECDDPTERAEAATDYAFIVGASESGGVLFTVSNVAHVTSAMYIVRQAYERVSE
ncbi:MAG: DUF1524 domain-containing protein, partial [Chloroflexi bacterium]|nr:DUF1524 domain-containing protein [Chloroflexota bacterium]